MNDNRQTTKEENSRNRYDKAYKALLRNPEAFCQFMRSLVKEDLAQNLRPDQLQAVNRSFVSSNNKQTDSDLIYKVALTPEQDIYFYILMELQSSVDDKMPLRMLEYVTQLYRVSAEQVGLKTASKKLPAIFPIVFYNGDKTWRQSPQIADMIDGAHVPSQFIPEMEYLLIDLSQFTDTDLEQMDGLVAAITYAENHGKSAEFASLLAELGQYIQRLLPQQVGVFKRWFNGVYKSRLSPEQLDQLAAELEPQENRSKNMLIDTIDRWKEEQQLIGLKRGEELGMRKGEELGLKRGEELGLKRGEELGLRRGEELGLRRGSIKSARNMLAGGLSIAQIVQFTGLSQEEVQQLQQES